MVFVTTYFIAMTTNRVDFFVRIPGPHKEEIHEQKHSRKPAITDP
jgi:hypothetical protein